MTPTHSTRNHETQGQPLNANPDASPSTPSEPGSAASPSDLHLQRVEALLDRIHYVAKSHGKDVSADQAFQLAVLAKLDALVTALVEVSVVLMENAGRADLQWPKAALMPPDVRP